MTDNKRKLEAIFHAAKELTDADQREIYVRDACKGDPELRNKVENLLKAAAESKSAFAGQETGAVENGITLMDSELSEGPGTTIGRYKLLQKVGEGGMGVVYMAEQTEPVTRKIALKIIKLGMDTKQVVARFEAERQALAMMDHPNIAKVLDAGATDTGRPYFVMELVRGVPITEYCDKNKLSTVERLRLFMPVCQAIQHAHQKGIIHRDIKPSNVMVTLHDGHPVPKVIDFGIAKATNQKLTEKTLFTNYAQMIGTPAYMSPEQAEMSGLDVDTRTDVYSLGVLLYELLTGTTPFPSKELMSMGYGEMQKIIAEKEPPKPSTRLSTMENEDRTVVAKNRSMEVSAMGKTFKGDLDWIVMKALEKDRSHRYETANGLVADIKRHLSDEPISAAAPTFGYQLSKFARRNKKYMRAAASVASLLVIAVLFSSFQAIRATKAEQLAVEAQNDEFEQKRQAQENLEKAKAAEADAVASKEKAETERNRADKQARDARLNKYVANIQLAHRFLKEGNTPQGKQLLLDAIPQDGEEDFRSFEWRYLWTEYAKEQPIVLERLPGRITDVAFNPDTSLLASCNTRGMIVVWDIGQRSQIATWNSHNNRATCLSFSFDGSRLVSMGHGGEGAFVQQWDMGTRPPTMIGEPIPSQAGGYNRRGFETQNAFYSPTEPLMAYQEPVGDKDAGQSDVVLLNYESNRPAVVLPNAGAIFAFSPDGTHIVTGAGTGSQSDIRVWNVREGRLIKSLGPISDLACEFIGNDSQIITSRGKQAQIWNWQTKKKERVIHHAKEKIYGIRISPTGKDPDKRLMAIADYAQVRLLSLPHFQPIDTLLAGGEIIFDLEFSNDGKWIAYGAGNKVFLHPLVQVAQSDGVHQVQFKQLTVEAAPHVPVSFDDQLLAVRQSANETRVMDVSGWNTLAVLNRDVWPVRFSKDGATVTLFEYPGGEPGEMVSGTIKVLKWDWRLGELTQAGAFPVMDAVVGVIHPGPGQQEKPFVAVRQTRAGFLIVDEHDFSTTRLETVGGIPDWSPTGRWFAARRLGADTDNTASWETPNKTVIWDTSDWTVSRELEGNGRSYSFADDQHLFAIWRGISAGFSYWDIEQDASPTELDAGVARLRSGDVSPDGRTLATGGSGSVLEFWNVETGGQLLSLEFDEEPTDVTFSSKGEFLMVKGRNFFKDTDEMPIQLFKAMTMEEIDAELAPHPEAVRTK